MDSAWKILYLFGGIFFLLTLIINFLVKTFPRLPGDIDLRYPSFQMYLPFTSAIVSTVLLTMLINYFFN